MSQIISITSQGQMSIPIKLRRALGLHNYKKALVRKEKNRIIIEPLENILSLGGSLQRKALKKKNIQKIRRLEKEAAQKGYAGLLR